MRIVVWLAGILAVGAVLQQSQAQTPEKPLRVSLCEIKAHPESFLHKLVEVTATASHGFEDSTLGDDACPGWPGVWMEYGGTRSTDTMYCCGFTPKADRPKTLVVDGIRLDMVDDEIFREFDTRLHRKQSKQEESSTVRATLRGKIFARYEGIMGTQQNPSWSGYGHMGCCMLFVVTQVVSLDSPR